MTRLTTILAVLALLVLLTLSGQTQPREPEKTEVRGHTMYTLLNPGDIPAIFDPRFIPVAIADSFYYPDEPLIVVADDTEARGYSVWHLDAHEVVNDSFNGRAMTVTW